MFHTFTQIIEGLVSAFAISSLLSYRSKLFQNGVYSYRITESRKIGNQETFAPRGAIFFLLRVDHIGVGRFRIFFFFFFFFWGGGKL